MENFEKNEYCTESHDEEIDFIFNQDSDDIKDLMSDQNHDLYHDFKMYFRFFKKKLKSYIRNKIQKGFTNVLYLTLDCPPFTPNSNRNDDPQEYITELQKQHPEYDIRIMMPVINTDIESHPPQKLYIESEGQQRVAEKTSISFEFFSQNKIQTATVYKYPKIKSNIQVYGIYSPVFSHAKSISEFTRLHVLAPFIKSARIAVKKLSKGGFNPDIIHSENIPYYLGGEFEYILPSKIKVLQIVKDFTQIDMAKAEAFWAILNLADKKTMKKICQDSLIKKYVAGLFKLHNTRRFYQMRDCLGFIYKNYYKFRKYVDKGEDIDENLIFNRLNSRVLQLFPNIAYGEKIYYNPMIYTLKRADFWAVHSKTYYNEIFKNPILSGRMFKFIDKTKEKSNYVSFGCNLSQFERENTRMIYQGFNSENFRKLRNENKKMLLKELSPDRIKTNFIDTTLFKDKEVKIIGSLDSFYEAPLMFVNCDTDIFANGIDILFNTVLKLFELHKNIQIIICIKNGMKINFIKNWLNFLTENKYLNGKWVFIDGEVNLPKFLAASDMILIPRRINMTNIEHFAAMYYGCVPIASRSGILNDTIPDIFDDISNGCGFKTKTGLLDELDANELFITPLMKAIHLYQNNPSGWNILVKNCLNHKIGWSYSVLEKYNQIYQKLI